MNACLFLSAISFFPFLSLPIVQIDNAKSLRSIVPPQFKFEGERWIAFGLKDPKKVLWSFPASGPIRDPILLFDKRHILLFHCQIAELLCVDYSGHIQWQQDKLTAQDPNPVVLAGDTLLYGSGRLAVGTWKPGREGLHTRRWLKDGHQIEARIASSGKRLWAKPELDVGSPLFALNARTYVSLRVANEYRVFARGDDPRYVLDVRSVKTGQKRASWYVSRDGNLDQQVSDRIEEAFAGKSPFVRQLSQSVWEVQSRGKERMVIRLDLRKSKAQLLYRKRTYELQARS